MSNRLTELRDKKNKSFLTFLISVFFITSILSIQLTFFNKDVRLNLKNVA